MFAEADSFWKPPTVYDVFSIVGLILGIASIWYAWFLARKQLRADFRKAADEAVDRVAQLVLGGDLADALRFLREADAALAEKEWAWGQMRLDDAASMMARFATNPKLTREEQTLLTQRVGEVRAVMLRTREHSRSPGNRGHLPNDQVQVLFTVIGELEHVRGRLMAGRTTATRHGEPNG